MLPSELEDGRSEKRYCPYCGEQLDYEVGSMSATCSGCGKAVERDTSLHSKPNYGHLRRAIPPPDLHGARYVFAVVILYLEAVVLVVFGLAGIFAAGALLMGGIAVVAGVVSAIRGRQLQTGYSAVGATAWFVIAFYVSSLLLLSRYLGSTSGWTLDPYWVPGFIAAHALPLMLLIPQPRLWTRSLMYLGGLSLLLVAWAVLCGEYSRQSLGSLIAAILVAGLGVLYIYAGRGAEAGASSRSSLALAIVVISVVAGYIGVALASFTIVRSHLKNPLLTWAVLNTGICCCIALTRLTRRRTTKR